MIPGPRRRRATLAARAGMLSCHDVASSSSFAGHCQAECRLNSESSDWRSPSRDIGQQIVLTAAGGQSHPSPSQRGVLHASRGFGPGVTRSLRRAGPEFSPGRLVRVFCWARGFDVARPPRRRRTSNLKRACQCAGAALLARRGGARTLFNLFLQFGSDFGSAVPPQSGPREREGGGGGAPPTRWRRRSPARARAARCLAAALDLVTCRPAPPLRRRVLRVGSVTLAGGS